MSKQTQTVSKEYRALAPDKRIITVSMVVEYSYLQLNPSKWGLILRYFLRY